jgi:hypothetical protein
MQVRFGTEVENITPKYTGESDPTDHVEKCMILWSSISKIEWTHKFIHKDTIMKNWYLELEIRKETTRWEELDHRLKVTFTFEHESSSIDATLQAIQTKIFLEEGSMELVLVCRSHKATMTIHELLECYNVSKEEHDEEDTINVQVPKTEGEHVVEGPNLESVAYTQPINTRKVNIGTTENPKFA